VAYFIFRLNLTGISLRFLNGAYNDRNLDNLSPKAVEMVVKGINYLPSIKLGTVLWEKIIELIIFKEANKRKKPLIAVIITDKEVSIRSPISNRDAL